MDNWKIEDVCVDTMWNIIYSIASYYNKKVNLMSYIYGEIIEKIQDKSMSLSALAKKKLFENNTIKYFSAIRDASIKAMMESDKKSEVDIEGEYLNERGFARLSILSNINSDSVYSPKTNKNIYLALGNVLKGFTLNNTAYENKSLFEAIYRYSDKHDTLYSSNAKTTANNFMSDIENEAIMDNLIGCFQNFLVKQIRTFQKEMYQQKADEFSIKVTDDILREVDNEYTMNTNNFSSVISLNLPRKILLLYGIDTDSQGSNSRRRR